jgi:hypothetical protein
MNNKKSFSRSILSLLFFCLISTQIFVASALSVYAQAVCGPNIGIPCNPVEGTISNLSDAVIVITLYLLSVVGLIALLFMVFAGIKYMLSVGDEEKMKSAKNSFNSAAFGLIIALLAYGILSVINSILNG